MSVSHRNPMIAAAAAVALVVTLCVPVASRVDRAMAGVEDLTFPAPTTTALSPFADGYDSDVAAMDVGDLDGDGRDDLAVLQDQRLLDNGWTVGTATTVTALVSNGDGTYTETWTHEVDEMRTSGSVAIVDLTADGVPDLVTAGDEVGGAKVWPGRGNGTFDADPGVLGVGTYDFGAPPGGTGFLRTGDLDGNGYADVVFGWYQDKLAVALSDANGVFPPPTRHDTTVGVLRDVTLADISGDGRPEIVVAGTTGLAVFDNDGNGGFTPGVRLAASDGQEYRALVPGDVDGDGDIDLLVGGGSGVATLDNDNGDLQGPVSWTPTQVPSGSTNSTTGQDLDGDGNLDALFAAGSTVVTVFGDGAGGFDSDAWLISTPEAELGDDFAGGQSTSHVVANDVDGDGHVDLVVGADGGTYASVNVLLADPDAVRRWSGAQVFKAADEFDSGFSLNLVEFTGDDHLDIVAIGKGSGLQVSAGTGDGTFEDAYTASDQRSCYWGYLDRTGDFDGDGNANVVCHSTIPFVYFGDGHGGVRGMQQVELGDPDTEFHLTTNVLPVDMDGDGKDELIVSSTRSTDAGNYQDDTTRVDVLRYNPETDALELVSHVDLGAPEDTSKDSTNGLVAGDFNDDGAADLATWFTPAGSSTMQRAVMLGDGTGGLGAPTLSATSLPHEYYVASRSGDVNGDGHPDIVSVTTVDGGRALVVELGDGAGAFSAPVAASSTTAPAGDLTGMALEDLDLDGHLDVVVDGDRTIEVHLGDGAGGFAPPVHLQRGGRFGTSVAVADVDGDARRDIVADGGLGAAVHRSGGDAVVPTVNLTVEEVAVPAGSVRAGDDATVEVTVRNTGTVATTGSWVDEVVLDAGDAPLLIGSALHQAPLAPGEAYTATITGSWPATPAGNHDLVATADARSVIAEDDEGDNTATAPVTATVDDLPYDLAVVGTVAPDRARLYRIVVDGEAAALTITAPETVRVATALGSVPADDQLVAVGDERVLRTGVHYLLIAGPDGGDAADYEVNLTRVDAGVHSVAPAQHHRGPSTFEVRGAGFQPDASVLLRNGSGTIPAETVQRVSSTLLLVAVDLTDAEVGGYDLVVHTGGIDHVLTDGIEVVDADPARFEVFVSVPETARLFRTSPVQVTVLNAGGVDALAPVVRVSTDRARLGRHDDGGFDTRSIDFLAVADDGSRVLAPGESAHVNARFDPDPDVQPGDDLGFSARAYGVTNVTPWGWASAVDRYRPDGLPDAVWAAASDAFRATVGGSAGSYALALQEVYGRLAELGLATDRGDRLIPRMVARAVAAVPGADLAGTVRDADGPLVERDVLLVDQAGGISQVTTTIDGDYAAYGVTPGTYDVHVRDAVPTPAAVVQVPRSERLDLTVGAPVSLVGRVLYPDGRGAGRVPVVVERVGQEGVDVGTAQTDASGHYVVPNMPTGTLRIVATARDHAPATTVVDVPDPGRVEVADLSLSEGLPVSGTITDASGAPVAGARVIVRSADGRTSSAATSQAGGGYEARGLPEGPVEITAVHPTAGQGTASVTLVATGGTADVVLQPGGALVGTVTSSNGGPLAGAVVLSDALRSDEVRTVADGSFRVDGVPAGDSRLEVRAPGHVPTSVPVAVVAGTDTDLGAIELPTLGTLPVTVTGAGDLPLPDVPVTATLIGGLGGTVRTGSDGVAMVRDLVPGRYLLQAGATAGPDSTRDVVNVVSGPNDPISLGADLSEVRGRVRTATGVPSAGAEVAAIVGGEPLLLTTTDASGAYTLLIEPGTDLHLRATSSSEHVAVVRDLHVGAADLIQDLTLGSSALDVQVDGPGSVAGVALALRLDGVGEVARTITDDGGAARFAGLPSTGGWTILAAGDGLAPGLVSGTLASGAVPVEIALTAGRSVSGSLLDGDGAPVAGGLVGTLDPGTGEPALTTSDADGGWTLSALSPGTVDVTAADGTDVTETTGVDLDPGSATDVVVTLDGDGGTVRGVVSDSAGTPLVGRMVELVREGLPVALTTTGSDGRYAIDGVPAGDWTLVASFGGGPSLHEPIVVPEPPTDGSTAPTVVADLVMQPAIGWILDPPFDLAPPGNVTSFNASLAPDAAAASVTPAILDVRPAGATILHASPIPAFTGDAPTVRMLQTGGGFTEAITGLPRPQKNAWAVANETTWRADQNRTDPIDWDCPPVVYSLESALSQSERDMNQAFYDLQASYGAVQDVLHGRHGPGTRRGGLHGPEDLGHPVQHGWRRPVEPRHRQRQRPAGHARPGRQRRQRARGHRPPGDRHDRRRRRAGGLPRGEPSLGRRRGQHRPGRHRRAGGPGREDRRLQRSGSRRDVPGLEQVPPQPGQDQRVAAEHADLLQPHRGPLPGRRQAASAAHQVLRVGHERLREGPARGGAGGRRR